MKTYEPWIQERALELANEWDDIAMYAHSALKFGSFQALMKLIEKHETKPVCEDLLLARKIVCDLCANDEYLDGGYDNYYLVQSILKTLKENKNA